MALLHCQVCVLCFAAHVTHASLSATAASRHVALVVWSTLAMLFSNRFIDCSGQSEMQGKAKRLIFCVLLPGVVKMRRGQVATFMLQLQTMKEVYLIFHQFATTIALK